MIESTLLQNRGGHIAGRWITAGEGGTFAVHDPASGEMLAELPDLGASGATAAVEAAAHAMAQPTSPEQRRHWLQGIAQLLVENKKELARIITREQGKPLRESEVEVDYSAGFFQFFASQLHHLNPEPLPQRIRQMRWTIHRRPAGVAALITPWNFPLAMLAKKLSAALAAGCGVVVKPPAPTPLTSIALWRLLERLDIPNGWLNLVIGRPGPIGQVLCSHPDVGVISFTGSTEIGKLLIQQSAPYVKRLAMELGGNAPFIVLDDADVTAAADALMGNKFRCAGQTCVCANRVYVQRGIEKEFVAAVAERAARLRVGNGSDPATDIGPLINRKAFDKVQRHVADALERGARRVIGSDPPRPATEWGAFYPPTLLTRTSAEMQVSREETFGPVIAIESFDTVAEAISKANGTPYGLAAYLFTRDTAQADALLARLHFGHVGLNTGTGPTPEAPFGGTKESGFGREGGLEGLYEFCELQTVVTP